ncbi:carboxypeptidase regulatory-like domain-containing protein [candidate division WOR-3 bacterium]|nr:carboxypeptidase regulatory-like domain-containing protein [candidate division WOR-3 bacterium]
MKKGLAVLILIAATAANAGSISGTVMDSLTEMPIPGAKVFSMTGYMWGDTSQTYTDSSGFYMITDLAEGSYMVQAEKDGYNSSLYPDTVEVYAGQNTPDINFFLIPWDTAFGSISGIVLDTMTGDPIMDARIYAVITDSTGDTLDPVEHEAYSDGIGFYKIENLDHGFYQVSAEHEDYYPATYPMSVEVVEGEETTGIDFGLFPLDTTEAGSISGLVVNALSGYPIMGAKVKAQNPDSTGDTLTYHGEAYTDSLGHYVISYLEAGVYKVTAHHPGYYTSTYPELVEVFAGEETPYINFALTPKDSNSCWITGSVTYNDSNAYSPGMAIAFSPYGQVLGTGIFEAYRDTVTGDTFVRYQIRDIPPTPCYVLGLAFGYLPQLYDHQYSIEDADLVYPPASRINFDFDPVFFWRSAFMSSSGGISGKVRGKVGPLPVSAVYARKDGEIVAGCVGDGTGSYQLPLEPGEYVIYATRPGYVTDQYMGTVTVANQEITDVDIALSPRSVSIKEEESENLPVASGYSLLATPNPFMRNTTIRYSIPSASNVSVKVYDVSGSMVKDLVTDHRPAGIHEVTWDGKDINGTELSSGVYFCRIEINRISKTIALIVIK